MMRCLFCRAQFEELAFYGCCSGCFVASLAVRTMVDGATPQTVETRDGFYVVCGDADHGEGA